MDNPSRSERTRKLVIDAALAIIARDGATRLTLDAIAAEAGLSKGGLMHQFRNKAAVIQALLEYQIDFFRQFSEKYLAEQVGRSPEPQLLTQIAVARHAVSNPQPASVSFALISMLGEVPELMSVFQNIDAQTVAAIRAESTDSDLAMLRYFAAQGMHLASIFGIGRISDEERERLFARLADGSQWGVGQRS